MIATDRRADIREALLIAEADAWFQYLESTKEQPAIRYEEIEPWAWSKLQQRLRAVRTRRAKAAA